MKPLLVAHRSGLDKPPVCLPPMHDKKVFLRWVGSPFQTHWWTKPELFRWSSGPFPTLPQNEVGNYIILRPHDNCLGSSRSPSPGLQKRHFLRKWALRHCQFHGLCPSMVYVTWHQPEQWLWSNSFGVWQRVSVHTCEFVCVWVHIDCCQTGIPLQALFSWPALGT